MREVQISQVISFRG